MRLTSVLTGLVLGFCSLVNAQLVDAPCDPTNQTCAPSPGYPHATYSIDFTDPAQTNPWPANWNQSTGSTPISFNSSDGAQLTFAKVNDAPQMMTNFYLLFGRVDMIVQCAGGTGIISSFVLYSNDKDEIDWEWSGSSFGKDYGQVQNNYFGKGVTGNWDRGEYENVSSPQTTFHKYSMDWTPDKLTWLIDDKAVRVLNKADCTNETHQYPQSPSKLQIGLWNAGGRERAPDDGKLLWAGGYTDMDKVPYIMRVKSINIQNTNPAYAYNWTDRSGSAESIQLIQDPNWNVTTPPPTSSSASLNSTALPTIVASGGLPATGATGTSDNSPMTGASGTSGPMAANTQAGFAFNSSFGFYPTNNSSSIASMLSGSMYPTAVSGSLPQCTSCGDSTSPGEDDSDDGSESSSSDSSGQLINGSNMTSPGGAGFDSSRKAMSDLHHYVQVFGPAAPMGPAGPGIEPPPKQVGTGAGNGANADGGVVSGPQDSSNWASSGAGGVPGSNAYADVQNTPGGNTDEDPSDASDSSADDGSSGAAGSNTAGGPSSVTGGITDGGVNGGNGAGSNASPDASMTPDDDSSSDDSTDQNTDTVAGNGFSGAPSGTGTGMTTKDLCTNSKKKVFFYHQGKSNYTVQCNADMPHMDMKNLTSDSFKSCIGSCEKQNVDANQTTCDGVSYMPSSHLCFLKSFSGARLVPARHSNRTHVAFNMSKKNGTAPIGFSRHYGGLTTRLR